MLFLHHFTSNNYLLLPKYHGKFLFSIKEEKKSKLKQVKDKDSFAKHSVGVPRIKGKLPK
jgi:hypothetical protein